MDSSLALATARVIRWLHSFVKAAQLLLAAEAKEHSSS